MSDLDVNTYKYKTPHIDTFHGTQLAELATALGNIEMCNTQAHTSLCDHLNDRLTTRHLPSLFSDIPGPSARLFTAQGRHATDSLRVMFLDVRKQVDSDIISDIPLPSQHSTHRLKVTNQARWPHGKIKDTFQRTKKKERKKEPPLIYCNPTIAVAGQQEEVREAGSDSTPKHFTPKNSGESQGQKSGNVTERGTMAKCKQDRDIKPPH